MVLQDASLNMPQPQDIPFVQNEDFNESIIPEEESIINPEDIPAIRNLRDRSKINPPAKYHDFIMAAVVVDEPTTYKEAIESHEKAEWLKAMETEMTSLQSNNTWILVNHPKDRKLISCKWVYKKKINADGSLDKYKSRLVARGYTQEKGIDYT